VRKGTRSIFRLASLVIRSTLEFDILIIKRASAGVECDGARYHSSKSARDRDRLREEVLRGLGWEILRVWSTDWFDNPELETEKLVGKLEHLRSGPPRTFHDYKVVDPFVQEQAEPVAELPSHNTADEGMPVPHVDLEDDTPLASPSERTVDEALFAGDKRLTIGQGSKALEQFREVVIKPEMDNWEPHRSILRDSMIETLITQQLSDPEEWFQKVPQFQRSGTNPLEKRLFLTRICEIIERIEGSITQGPGPNEPFTLTPPNAARLPYQTPLPLRPSANDAPAPRERPSAKDPYVVVDIADLPVAPCADRFYEPAYKAIIGRMTSYIIEIEGPVYDDVIITRIARVHGFQRTGSSIQKLVLSAIDRRFPRTTEDGRDVFWCAGAQTGAPVSFRKSASDVRSHNDIPIPELASLALPFVRIRMDDEQVLRKMAEHFGLGRLREVTRIKFQKSVTFARSSHNSGRLSSNQ
jgi:REase_MTES_1575/Protein of unknown function (DUF3320)